MRPSYGRGKSRHVPGSMNKLEARYGQHLELLKRANKILWYEFEALKFKLAASTFYTPDFVVMSALYEIEIHEVKGFWMDDARVKIKVAADKFPFHFKAIKLEKGVWVEELFA